MARGRMLNKSVSLSDKFNSLPDDTSRLLATWLIPHLDYRGVFYADAIRVRTQVFSMREDLTTLRVKHCLEAIEAAGLFKTFQARNQVWMFWPGFEHNQINLRKDRESTPYPPPPADYIPEASDMTSPEPETPCDNLPDDFRQPSGNVPDVSPPKMPEDVPQNLREVNLREDSAAKPAPAPSGHNVSTSNSTEPPADSAPTQTPIPQTDRTRAGTYADLVYQRAIKAQANPALAQVRKWTLAERIEGVCIDYVELAVGTPVVESDKGKWSKGAKDILELFRASGRSYSRAWMQQAIKHATFTHSHPMALDTAFRELFKLGWKPADAPDDDGFVSAGFRHNADGTVTQLVKQVARA